MLEQRHGFGQWAALGVGVGGVGWGILCLATNASSCWLVIMHVQNMVCVSHIPQLFAQQPTDSGLAAVEIFLSSS